MDFERNLIEAQNQLRRYFLRLTGNDLLTEEIIQFVSIQAWRFWSDKNGLELTRRMAKAGRNHFFNQLDKERSQRERIINAALQHRLAAQQQRDAERIEHVRVSLGRLPRKWRQVLDLAFFENRTNVEIAQTLGKSVDAIKNWRRRGLLKLRSILEGPSNN